MKLLASRPFLAGGKVLNAAENTLPVNIQCEQNGD